MLILNLQPIFKAKGIERPFSFLVNAGFSNFTAHNLMHGKAQSFQLHHIEKLCTLFNCTPNDLFVWKPNRNEIIPENFMLKRLKNNTPDIDWHKTFENLPLDELQQLIKTMKGMNPDKKE